MLFDDEEIQIMANALQPQLQEPSLSDVVSTRIFDDLCGACQLAGSKILELGPGQYDLTRMVAAADATVVAMDHDPAVIALGKRRGYNVILADFRSFDWNSLRGEFNGLLGRNSIAPEWFCDAESLGSFVDQICSVLKPTGWGWIAPWNKALSRASPARAQLMLDAEDQAFGRNGFAAINPSPKVAARYSISLCPRLFLRGIDLPRVPQDD